MSQGFRDFLETSGGKLVAGVVFAAAAVVAFFSIRATFGPSEAARLANDRVFVDSTTGKPFNHTLTLGEKIPVEAPSGGATGFPAEACYWTKEGGVRKEPYWVLLNSWVGKPEPTFCPDCGRLVVGHNPAPYGANPKPPPTQQEYKGVVSPPAGER